MIIQSEYKREESCSVPESLCLYSCPVLLFLSSSSLLSPELGSLDKRLQSAETQRPWRLNKEPVEEEDGSDCQPDVLFPLTSDVFSAWTGNQLKVYIRGHMEDNRAVNTWCSTADQWWTSIKDLIPHCKKYTVISKSPVFRIWVAFVTKCQSQLLFHYVM